MAVLFARVTKLLNMFLRIMSILSLNKVRVHLIPLLKVVFSAARAYALILTFFLVGIHLVD